MDKLLDRFQVSSPFLDRKLIYATSVLVLLAAGSQITDCSDVHAQTNDPNSPVGLIELWEGGQTAFGQYVTGVPYTVETGRDLAANTLLDYAFLNLEQEYNVNSALELAEGLRSGAGDGADSEESESD
jgi:hypothetical protein